MPDLEQLTEQLKESYGLHMPMDIWQQAHDLLSPDSRVANMLDMSDAFPLAFHDSVGLTDATLDAMSSEWYGFTPRLDAMIRTLKPYSSVAEIDRYFAMARANHDTGALMHTNHLSVQYKTSDPLWNVIPESQQAIELKRRITLSQLLDNNLSQTVRFEQERVWRENRIAFFKFAAAFRKWGWNEGISYSIRHPIAMNNNHFSTLESVSILSGIPLPAMYLTATQQIVLDELDDSAHEGLFFDAQMRTALENHRVYSYWARLNAYAQADWGHGIVTAITPACMPPWLLRVGGKVLPIYLLKPIPVYSFAEQAVTYMTVGPDTIEYAGSHVVSADHQRRLANALSILCIGVTLYASTIRLGSGHKRPTWIRTPMNMTLLRTFESALETESKLYV